MMKKQVLQVAILCGLGLGQSLLAEVGASDGVNANNSGANSTQNSHTQEVKSHHTQVKGTQAKDKQVQNSGGVFLGVGLGAGGYGMAGAEVLAGYEHYFPKEYYLGNAYQQGVRGYISAGYSYDREQYSSVWGSYKNVWEYHYVPVTIGADYLINWNPQDKKFVWGSFVGVGLGFLYRQRNYSHIDNSNSVYSYSNSSSAFGVAWRFIGGVSLTINQRHRLELAAGAGVSYASLRYIVLF